MSKASKLKEHNQKNFFTILDFFSQDFENMGQFWDQNPGFAVRKSTDFRIFRNLPNFEQL